MTAPNLRLARPTEDDPRPASRVPAGGSYQPDRLADEQPASQPGGSGRPETDGGQLFIRLSIAFGVIMGLLAINFVLLERFGLGLPPEILLSAFGVIAIAGVVAAFQGAPDAEEPTKRSDADDGCAVGLCPGPRPPRFLRK